MTTGRHYVTINYLYRLDRLRFRRKTMFHKILICSDGSEYAQNAALLGSEIARRFQSEVLGLHVFDLSIITAGDVGVCSIPVSQEAMDNMMKSQREAAERVITPIFEQLERPYRMLQELGNPVDSIVQVAQREQADLILVGHQGMTGLKELFLGSVSYSVLQHAHCPVLVERGPAKPFGRILLTSDASAGAERAASLAFALAQRFDACLTVLNIAEPSGWFAAEEPNPNPVEAAEEHIAAERGERAVEESIQAAA